MTSIYTAIITKRKSVKSGTCAASKVAVFCAFVFQKTLVVVFARVIEGNFPLFNIENLYFEINMSTSGITE